MLNSKTKVTLQFPNLRLLWKFAQTISCNSIEIHRSKITITCECSEDEIESALKNFQAVMLQSKEFST